MEGKNFNQWKPIVAMNSNIKKQKKYITCPEDSAVQFVLNIRVFRHICVIGWCLYP